MEESGFICPLCREDFFNSEQLLTHYTVAHGDATASGSPHLLKKFSKKLSAVFNDIPEAHAVVTEAPSNVIYFKPEPGFTTSHWSYFSECRRRHVDLRVVEANRLIYNLDKLLDISVELPEGKRRDKEQEIQPWFTCVDMPICNSCGKKFSRLYRREHHCRLCGVLICGACSHQLSRDLARTFCDPSISYDDSTSPGFLKRSGSENSIFSSISGEGSPALKRHIRLCGHCRDQLENRREKDRIQNEKSDIVRIYELMMQMKEYIESNFQEYESVLNALWAGKRTYTLADGATRQRELAMKLGQIEQLSGKILAMYPPIVNELGNSRPDSSRAAFLAKEIRNAMVQFIQQNAVIGHKLPTEEEYERHVEEASRRLEKRVAEEREKLARLQHNTMKSSKSMGAIRETSGMRHSATWVPDEVYVDETADPLVQQIDKVKQLLVSARRAGHSDEARALKENLDMLQSALRSQQAANWGAS